MSAEYLAISPHDPIIARDGRPFGKNQGIRMKSLDWPYPSVLAGSLRTMLGKMNGEFSDATVQALLEIDIAGPLPMKGKQLYLPHPKDILAKKTDKKIIAIPLRPVAMRDGKYCDLPMGGLLPTMLPNSVDEGFKPEKMPAFWSMSKMTAWLANPNGSDFTLCPDSKTKPEEEDVDDQECKKSNPDFLDAPEKDERVHVGISSDTGSAEDGLLFMSVGLDLASRCPGNEIRLAAKVNSVGVFEKLISKLDGIHPFGGERRLAQWSRIKEPIGWSCPDEISSKLVESNSGKIRMVLATPAIFLKGWLPRWLSLRTQEDGKEILEGIPPEALDSQRLRLVSACVDRWKPISGWSAENKSRGPKAIRRLVPAGSVYFFEAQSGKEASALAKSHWLRSVCDDPQDCKDGFGLAVWGVWEEAEKEDNKGRR
jgi:CRISPR-associated protein Cmr3